MNGRRQQQHELPVLEVHDLELVVDEASGTGEGPLWDEDAQLLYWVDIPTGRLFAFDPERSLNTLVHQHDGMIGGYTLQEDGSLLLFGDRGRIVHLRDGETEVIVDEIPAEREGRFNDVIADPRGRIFCGTMPSGNDLARLYRLDPDGTLTLVFEDIGLSNGLGFSPDDSVLYHTDSNGHRIYRLDYDAGTGELSNRQVLIETPDDGTVPDGMTVDREGTIWSARWDGHALFRYDAAGQLLGTVPMPVRKVSSIAFGGPDLGTAYVTTAGGRNRGKMEGDKAGSLFRVDLGVRGRAPFRSRIGLA
ncbi:MAG: SMP-30/gluconolactonase/LRE family protein [Chloroflexota bacterium]|nr:SMP-30/gluconolactonase/LRE family protein [Chloroflexota bacterium]